MEDRSLLIDFMLLGPVYTVFRRRNRIAELGLAALGMVGIPEMAEKVKGYPRYLPHLNS